MENNVPTMVLITPVDRPIRPILLEFVARMEVELQANRDKGGWDDCDDEFLRSELVNHLESLLRMLKDGGTFFENKVMSDEDYEAQLLEHHLQGEAADIANFAMMLWDNGRHKAKDILIRSRQ